MEFKGTKGKWILRDGYRIDIVTKNDESFGIVDFGTEQEAYLAGYPLEKLKANALLISKAPEMLEMLQWLYSRLGTSFSQEKEEIEQLIKEATDI